MATKKASAEATNPQLWLLTITNDDQNSSETLPFVLTDIEKNLCEALMTEVADMNSTFGWRFSEVQLPEGYQYAG